MDYDTLKDRQLLWQMHYAEKAFALVQEAADHIIANHLEYGDKLFYPLFTSIALNYARPFKRSNVIGRLSDKIVPEEYRNLHEQLILLRDKLFAHSDPDGPQDQWGSINQVRYCRTKTEISSHTFEVPSDEIAMKHIFMLCKILREKTDYHIRKLERKYLGQLPKIRGDYLLNVDPNIQEFFIPIAPIPNAFLKNKVKPDHIPQ